MTEARRGAVWVRVSGTHALAVSNDASHEKQRGLVERVVHALEALAQHGSTSAEESLAGVPLRPLEALRADGIEVRTADAFLARLASPEA